MLYSCEEPGRSTNPVLSLPILPILVSPILVSQISESPIPIPPNHGWMIECYFADHRLFDCRFADSRFAESCFAETNCADIRFADFLFAKSHFVECNSIADDVLIRRIPFHRFHRFTFIRLAKSIFIDVRTRPKKLLCCIAPKM